METSNKKIPPKTYQRAIKRNASISISRCSDVPVEFESLCRLCLDKTDCMSEIFQNDCTVSTDVKIRTLLGLKVEEDDDLPSLICDTCLIGLNEFYTFKKRCIASDVRLRQILVKMSPKYQTSTSDHSYHDFTLPEDISNLKLKKSDCTISWDDNVPLISTIITEYDNSLRKLPDSNREGAIDEENDREIYEENTTENDVEQNYPFRHDVEEMPLALRLAIIQEQNLKSRGTRFKKMKFSKVRTCQCSKKTPDCKTLKNHAVLKYKCADCSKMFRTLSLLRRHYTVHSRKRPYVCYMCDLTYPLKDTLYRHIMQTHESVKPFKCDYCSKSFSLSYLLKSHIKTSHTTKPKFRCSHCPKVFTHASGLSRHNNVHNGTRYICKICYKKFTDPSSVKRHSKKIHHITW